MTVDEAQAKITSTGFLDWLAFFEVEWHEKSKQDFYLAQIAATVRQVLEAFSKSPKQIKIGDYLLKFKDEKVTTIPVKERAKDGRIEIGPDAIKDPKWAAVNAKAKAMWGARLGIKELGNA